MTQSAIDLPGGGRATLVRKGQYVVLRVAGSGRYISRDYAPSHLLSDSEPESRAADLVFSWTEKERPTGADLELARLYLAQWPDGPQAGGGAASVISEKKDDATAASRSAKEEKASAERQTPAELLEAINRMMWELGDYETDSDRAVELRAQVHAALGQLRAEWRKGTRLQ